MTRPTADLPYVRAISFGPSGQSAGLTRRDMERLALISTRMRVGAHRQLFRRGGRADYIYNLTEGVIKSFRETPQGRKRVVGFLFPGDLLGLARKGKYVNTAETLTSVTLFKVPLDQLRAMAQGDSSLTFGLLCNVTHSLREAQRRMLIVSSAYAPGRVAMFLNMLREFDTRNVQRITLPVSIADLADYVDLSTEAVNRAIRELERSGVVAREAGRTIRITDPRRFDHIAAGGHL
jgi:CRP/FNR family transcriptional regulator, anaerobic regulatory protein